MGKPNIPNLTPYLMGGRDFKTDLPTRIVEDCNYKKTIYNILKIIDEQNAINRYVWHNLPNGLNTQLVERILYYKGQAMFFKMKDEFFFLPYALEGTIDVYGRFNDVTPLPFTGTAKTDEKAWITGLSRKVVKEILTDDEIDNDIIENGCVLLHDYCKGISQLIIPRNTINDKLIDMEAEAFPMGRTALIANSGIKGMRVTTEDEQSNVAAANTSILNAALTGKFMIPVIGPNEFQDLTEGSASQAQDYLVYMQALDNFRLSLYGLRNGGVFEKQSSYVNDTQADNAQANVGLVYQDGLTIRQDFCDKINAIWKLDVWCEESETVAESDMNNDEVISDSTNEEGGMSDGND